MTDHDAHILDAEGNVVCAVSITPLHGDDPVADELSEQVWTAIERQLSDEQVQEL